VAQRWLIVLPGGTEPEAIEQTAALTRKYARRQVSWFNRYPGAQWLDYDDPERVARALRHATGRPAD